jgi:glycolate oxidase
MSQLEQLAERLEPWAYHYLMGGSASEATLRRNRRALERLALEQSILVDVREMDLSTELFGLTLPMPVIVAPMGSLHRFWPEGDLAMARGAGRDGALSTVTGVCAWPIEQIADEASGPLIFQLYWQGDRDWTAARLERVHSRAQYKAIALTVDSAVYSRRDRDLAGNFVANASTGGRAGLPEPANPEPRYPMRLTWEDADWLRSRTTLPLGLKGVMTAADARRAVEHGMDFMWVSNHGGRQLDDGRATIDAVREVVQAVAGRVPVIVDGGFTRGTDVIKGLALGATAVAMGKACAWGLAAAGSDGIQQMLRIIREELRIGLALSGHTRIGQLTPGCVRRIDY